MYVYLVHALKTNLYKIGFATNIKSRLQSLQSASPFHLQLIASAAGSRSNEEELHRRFALMRQKGEWFEFSDIGPVVDAIKNIELIPEGPRPVYVPDNLTDQLIEQVISRRLGISIDLYRRRYATFYKSQGVSPSWGAVAEMLAIDGKIPKLTDDQFEIIQKCFVDGMNWLHRKRSDDREKTI